MTEVAIPSAEMPGVAIVTGGGRGLGRAMALGLLAAGFRVTVNDIDQDAIDEAIDVATGAGSGQRALGIRADVSDPEQCELLVDKTVREFGGLDILVNNAGVGPEIVRKDFMTNPIRLWEIPVEAWCRALAINTFAPCFTARAAVPHMLAGGRGRIVNITTSLDTMLRPGYAPYGGSKAATEAFTAILAGDLEGTGVTANVLIPGGAANTRLIPDDTPIDRHILVQPDQMVPPLLWLVSDAASEVTGMRFVARFWDPALAPGRAAEAAGAPIGWPGIERVHDRPPV